MRRSRGFTLLEMLISLAILGVGSALLVQTSWSGNWTAKQGWTETRALRLAQSVGAEAGIALKIPGAGTDIAADGLPFSVHVYPVDRSRFGTHYQVDVRENDRPDHILATVRARPAGAAP